MPGWLDWLQDEAKQARDATNAATDRYVAAPVRRAASAVVPDVIEQNPTVRAVAGMAGNVAVGGPVMMPVNMMQGSSNVARTLPIPGANMGANVLGFAPAVNQTAVNTMTPVALQQALQNPLQLAQFPVGVARNVGQAGGYLANAVQQTPNYLRNDYLPGAQQGLGQFLTGPGFKSGLQAAAAVADPLLKLGNSPVHDIHIFQGEGAYYAATHGGEMRSQDASLPFNFAIQWATEHPEEWPKIKQVFEQGYDDDGDGKPDYTGAEAVWQYYIGKQDESVRFTADVLNDPWNATLLVGGLESILGKGGAKIASKSPEGLRAIAEIGRSLGWSEETIAAVSHAPEAIGKGVAGLGKGAVRLDAASQDVLNLPFKAAGQLARGIGWAGGKTETGRAVGRGLDAVGGAAGRAASRFADSRAGQNLMGALGETAASKTSRLASDVATTLGNISDTAAPEWAVPVAPTHRYEAVLADRNTGASYIVDPEGNPVPGYAQSGKGAHRSRQSLADNFNTTGAPPESALDTPPASAVVAPTAPTAPQPEGFTPAAFQPDQAGRRADINAGMSVAAPNINDTRLTSQVEQLRATRPEEASAFYHAIGIDPATGAAVPGTPAGNLEQNLKTVSTRFYGTGEGDLLGKVADEKLTALMYTVREEAPVYQTAFGESVRPPLSTIGSMPVAELEADLLGRKPDRGIAGLLEKAVLAPTDQESADAANILFRYAQDHPWLEPSLQHIAELRADAAKLPVERSSPNAVTGFTTAKGSTYTIEPNGATTRNKSYHPEHGPNDVGPQLTSERTVYADPADQMKMGAFQTKGATKQMVLSADGKTAAFKFLDGPYAGKLDQHNVFSVTSTPEVGKIPVELWDDGHTVHFGNEITEVRAGVVPSTEPAAIAPGSPETGVERAAPGLPAQAAPTRLMHAAAGEEVDAWDPTKNFALSWEQLAENKKAAQWKLAQLSGKTDPESLDLVRLLNQKATTNPDAREAQIIKDIIIEYREAQGLPPHATSDPGVPGSVTSPPVAAPTIPAAIAPGNAQTGRDLLEGYKQADPEFLDAIAPGDLPAPGPAAVVGKQPGETLADRVNRINQRTADTNARGTTLFDATEQQRRIEANRFTPPERPTYDQLGVSPLPEVAPTPTVDELIGTETPQPRGPVSAPPTLAEPTPVARSIIDEMHATSVIDDVERGQLEAVQPGLQQPLINEYLDRLRTGMTTQQAIGDIQKQIYGSARKATAVKPGVLKKVLHAADESAQMARQNMQYNIANGASGFLGDRLGNKALLWQEGKFNALARTFDPNEIWLSVGGAEKVAEHFTAQYDPLLAGFGRDLPEHVVPKNPRGADILNKQGFADNDMVTQKLAKRLSQSAGREDTPLVLKGVSSAIASPFVVDRRAGADLSDRAVLAVTEIDNNLDGAVDRFAEKLTAAGLPSDQTIDAIRRHATETHAPEEWRTRNPKGVLRSFSPDDVFAVTGNEQLRRAWRTETNALYRNAGQEATRIFFAGAKRYGIDDKLSKVFFFHFWASRSLALQAKAMLRNPRVMGQYYRMMQGAMNQADQKGYPNTFKGLLHYWGDTDSGWYGLFNPMGVLVPAMMFGDLANMQGEGKLDKLSSILPISPLVSGAAAALGLTDDTPNFTGTARLENLVTDVLNWGNAHGMDFGRGGLISNPAQYWTKRTLELINQKVGQHVSGQRYEPYDPKAGRLDTIKSVVYQEAVDDWGPQSNWTTAQLDEVNQAMTAVEVGGGDNERANRAFGDWADANMRNRLAGLILPQGSVLRYGPRETARNDANAGDQAANDQRNLVTASPDTRNIVIGQDKLARMGTERQNSLYNDWQAIVYDVDKKTGTELNQFVDVAGQRVTVRQLQEMDEDQRKLVANAFVQERGGAQELAEYRDMRDAAIASNPALADFKEYKDFVSHYANGGIPGFRAYAASVSPEFAKRQEAYRAKQVKKGIGGKALEAELDQWVFFTDAYTAFQGKRDQIYDAAPLAGASTANDPLAVIRQGSGDSSGYSSGGGSASLADRITKAISSYQQRLAEYQAAGGPTQQLPGMWGQGQQQMYGSMPQPSEELARYVLWVNRQPQGSDTSPQAYEAFVTRNTPQLVTAP